MTLPLSGDSSFFLDLYSRYMRDPSSVPSDWRFHFENLGEKSAETFNLTGLGEALQRLYRQHGHLQAMLDPLGLVKPSLSPEIAAIDVRSEEKTRIRIAGKVVELTAQECHARLSAIYCGNVALEAGHLTDADERSWLYEAFEREIGAEPAEADIARTLEAVLLADEFEAFVKMKWPTKKRFGLEGAESLAVIMREAFYAAAGAGVGEVVIGGMHRGRLATLATVLGKSLPALLAEIKGREQSDGDPHFTGDVPYHNGLSARVETGAGMLDVKLLPHPSHLIVVAPVAVGAARGRQELKSPKSNRTIGRRQVLPFLMHTDAAFSGQGLVWELMQLSGLEGYSVGGTIHLVVNNQIGFTTLPTEGRSTTHPTDVGKAFGVPVLHVNGDHPVAAAAAARVAVQWRNKTGRDILIDLVCYRRNGHNELDEPRFTQPKMWKAIESKASLRHVFSDFVASRSTKALKGAEERCQAFRVALDDAYANLENSRTNHASTETEIFAPPQVSGEIDTEVVTGVERDKLVALTRTITAIPTDYDADPKVRLFQKRRLESVETDIGFNMATAEALAFASLLDTGVSVRLSGQDCVRGTFTQRHLAVHDRATGQNTIFLTAAARDGASFEAINSPLSEYGVLSFEYGYSLATPKRLTVWEAQFGDFLNGAQIVVDQFIVTAEAKWRMASNLVIALPHGMEGQGPDHSSARVERILQSCSGANIIVANASTPANLFHLYRRQVLSSVRKPLFLIAPKSLLRAKACRSSLAEIAAGTSFQPIIIDRPTNDARAIILCSGKIYYDLKAYMSSQRIDDVAIIRLEQLYPFPMEQLQNALNEYRNCPLIWCQEEPGNQGAFQFVRNALLDAGVDRLLQYVGRPPMAAAAGGSIDRHEREQAGIVEAAFETFIDRGEKVAAKVVAA